MKLNITYLISKTKKIDIEIKDINESEFFDLSDSEQDELIYKSDFLSKIDNYDPLTDEVEILYFDDQDE